jgi:hypothetical protein
MDSVKNYVLAWMQANNRVSGDPGVDLSFFVSLNWAGDFTVDEVLRDGELRAELPERFRNVKTSDEN